MKQASSAYPPAIWAQDIAVDSWSPGRLFVRGKLPIFQEELLPEHDPFLRYLSSVQSEFAQRETELRSPHVRFANATRDDELVEFVREFGPVLATEVVEDKGDQTESARI